MMFQAKHRKRAGRIAAPLALILCTASGAFPGEPTDASSPDAFRVYGGKTLLVPGGASAFADQVVSFRPGDPGPIRQAADPTRMLGSPDCRAEADGAHYTLGCGGEVVVAFMDNELIDGPGPDLLIVEVGDAREAVEVSVSKDGVAWRVAGEAPGGVTALDLGQSRERDPEIWRFVRLHDRAQRCQGPLPGADIDALAALGLPRPPSLAPAATAASLPPARETGPALSPGKEEGLHVRSSGLVSAQRARIAASVLFEYDRWELLPEGKEALLSVVRDLPQAEGAVLLVGGHADARGTDAYNLDLSRKRAEAVADFLRGHGEAPTNIRTEAFGKSRPVADNETEQGRARNRRVEISLVPPEKRP